MDIDPAVVMDPRIQSMPEPYRWRLFVLWCYQDKGMKLRDADLAPALGITGEELAETKAAIVERGWFDEGWSMLEPPPTPPSPSNQPKASGAERQRKYRERLKGRRNGEVGDDRCVTRDVTRVTGPGVTRDVTQNVTRYEPVTRVTPPPQTPPNKSLNLDSNIQTDTHTYSGRVCDGTITRPVTTMGPDGPVEAKPECSPEEVDRLIVLVNRYFEPYCLTDQVGRFVRNWSVNYPADWIEAVLAKLAGKAADGMRFGEGLGRSVLQGWARSGGMPPGDRVPSREDVEAAAAAVPLSRASPRAAPPERPMTRQQRKMARYSEIAFGPQEGEDDGDERGEAVGQADHGGPRREDEMHRRAGA